ncbi:MAG: 4Fe-4S binding protein [Desulfotomaculum sp.]|nr:4Fe-4S binding protein [Desulfotomaculum sp.]
MAKKEKNLSLRNYAWSILVVFLIAGWFYPAIGLMAIVCMAAPIIVAAFSGKRKWCALFCPRGIFNDVILKKITRNVKPPAFLTSTAFKVGFFVFLMANLIIGLIGADTIAEAGFVFVRLVSVTTAIAIVLGFYYQQRAWCGFCPMGFLASLTIRWKQKFNKKRQEKNQKLRPVPHNITLYTGSTCPPCLEVKEYLTKKGIKFNEKNIDQDKEARQEMVSIYKSTAVPTLIMDGKIHKNITVNKLEQLLKDKLPEKKAS